MAIKQGDKVRHRGPQPWSGLWQDCTVVAVPARGSKYYDVRNAKGEMGLISRDEIEPCGE